MARTTRQSQSRPPKKSKMGDRDTGDLDSQLVVSAAMLAPELVYCMVCTI